jgi:hypothetical protein
VPESATDPLGSDSFSMRALDRRSIQHLRDIFPKYSGFLSLIDFFPNLLAVMVLQIVSVVRYTGARPGTLPIS